MTADGGVGARDLVAWPMADRAVIGAFLERDRRFSAYAICDLDERLAGRARWGLAMRGDVPVAAALEFTALAPQPVFVLGSTEGIALLLRRTIRPRAAIFAALPEALPGLSGAYRVEPGPTMLRMWVDRSTFRPYPDIGVERLSDADAPDLNRLYQLGFGSWLSGRAIAEGVYYGIRVNGRLVAAAGTHVISRAAGLACVGNVLTHAEYRGRGYATATTSAVTADLLLTCRDVVLNVRADNPPALGAYRHLGYAEHVAFEERAARRIASPWSDLVTAVRRRLSPTKEPVPR